MSAQYWVYLNTGTTNTRIYLIKDELVRYYKKMKIGSKDVSINNNNYSLLSNIKKLYEDLLEKNKLKSNNIDEIFISGMATSIFGLKNINHISTPVSINKLVKHIHKYYESKIFKREINLIPGVKTRDKNFKLNYNNFYLINHMRGEEIEIFGVLKTTEKNYKRDLCIILPGSHTQIVYVRDKKIIDIFSTISGELFHSLKNNTILSNSIEDNNREINKKMLLQGTEIVKNYGINRSLYLLNTMQIFNGFNSIEKTSYLEGVVLGKIIFNLKQLLKDEWCEIKNVVVMGNSYIIKLYKIMLQRYLSHNIDIIELKNRGKKSFAVEGLIEIKKIL